MFTFVASTTTSGTRKYEWYLDGQLLNTETNPYDYNNNLPTSGNLYIGSNCEGICNIFKGKLDEIRIYDKALTAQDISILYDKSSVQKSNVNVTITKGATSKTVEVKAVDDVTQEPTEAIIAKIISATGATETGDQSATIYITDNDSTFVNLSVSTDPIKEGEETFATITATLDKVSELPVTAYIKPSGLDLSLIHI